MKTHYILVASLLVLPFCPFYTAVGQDIPVEVTADNALEWDRNALTFVARGNARVSQGDTSITAAKLTAKYSENKNGMNVETVTATGKTTIKNADATGYGDSGFYNVTDGYAELGGTRPRIETQESVLSADDKIQYYMTENKVTATGNAVLTRASETLTADTLTAFLVNNDGANGTQLKNVVAAGNVVVKTDGEALFGDHADYIAKENKVIVTGNVRIEQGQNILTGDKAEFDMTTNTSTLSSGKKDGRVRAVFHPGPQKETQ